MNTLEYEILARVQAGAGSSKVFLGSTDFCRFCDRGTGDGATFNHVAHTIPEGLGNHWVISLDECDDCNKLFSTYDDALCKSIGPILTIGGVKGKENKVRQTGRTVGQNNIISQNMGGNRVVSTKIMDVANGIRPAEGSVIIFPSDPALPEGLAISILPVPIEKFVPRYAYKALVKIALALIPAVELKNFQSTLAWVRIQEDNLEFPFLDVGISLGEISNAPEYVAARIIRTENKVSAPYCIVMYLKVGSICWKISVDSDECVSSNVFGEFHAAHAEIECDSFADDINGINVEHTQFTHFDWSSKESSRIPVFGILTKSHDGAVMPNISVVWNEMKPS